MILHSTDTIFYLHSIYLFFKASLASFDASHNPVRKEGPSSNISPIFGYGSWSTCWYITLLLTITLVVDLRLSDLSPKICWEHNKRNNNSYLLSSPFGEWNWSRRNWSIWNWPYFNIKETGVEKVQITCVQLWVGIWTQAVWLQSHAVDQEATGLLAHFWRKILVNWPDPYLAFILL